MCGCVTFLPDLLALQCSVLSLLHTEPAGVNVRIDQKLLFLTAPSHPHKDTYSVQYALMSRPKTTAKDCTMLYNLSHGLKGALIKLLYADH